MTTIERHTEQIPISFWYECFNSGNFCGTRRFITPNNELIPTRIEQALTRCIMTLHNQKVQDIYSVDIGGMLGIGQAMVNANLPSYVRNKCHFIVTNKEKIFTINRGISAMRLINKAFENDPIEAEKYFGHKSNYPTEHELNFIERNNQGIRYRSRFDSRHLPELKQKFAPNGFHIIHEFCAGLERHDRIDLVFNMAMKALNRKYGMLITGLSPVMVEESVDRLEKDFGVRIHCPVIPNQRKQKDIFVYAYPHAPYAVFAQSLGL